MTIGSLLEKAARSFDAAERLLQAGDNDFGASRTYYGYFYIAQALLLSMGLSYGRHGQVVAQYGLHFAKTQRLAPAFHRLLDRAFEIRHTALITRRCPSSRIGWRSLSARLEESLGLGRAWSVT
jgi:uncharacterized protein (UPF0332 family)